MKHRVKVSVKQTKKMKKAGMASQRVELVLEMAFFESQSSASATKAMGVIARQIVEQSSLLCQYLPEDGEVITHIEKGGKYYALEETCRSCINFDDHACKLGNHCTFCSEYDRRES